MHQNFKNIIDLNNKVKQKIQELDYTNYNPKIIDLIKPLDKEEYKERIVYHPKNETFYRTILIKPVTGKSRTTNTVS